MRIRTAVPFISRQVKSKSGIRLTGLLLAVMALGVTAPASAEVSETNSVFQFSAAQPGCVAFLWVPPKCAFVRGLVVVKWNYLDEDLLQDPQIRQTCARENLGLVCLVHTNPEMHKRLSQFILEEGAAGVLTRALSDLATTSGYTEIAEAPLLPIGHSAGGGFAWGVPCWNKARVFGALPLKTGASWDVLKKGDMEGVPVLHLVGQFFEWSSGPACEQAAKDSEECLALRQDPRFLVANGVEWGGGHFEWSEECARLVSLFIAKAAHYRLPEKPAGDGSFKLKELDPEAGWLMSPGGKEKPVPASAFRGDKRQAFWFFDEEYAEACRNFAQGRLAKKMQQVTFFMDGKPVPFSGTTGAADLNAMRPLADGVTYKLSAGFFDKMPEQRPGAGAVLGHADGPISIHCDVGPFIQTGPDTFRVRFSRISYYSLITGFHASHPGNAEYRYSVMPGLTTFKNNTEGRPQKITFDAIPDVQLGTREIKLTAVSDAGATVEFFVLAGPAEIREGNLLSFTDIPPRTKFPVRVTVVAWQYGHSTEPKLQTAERVERSFFLNKP
jgi:hypothetical protein